MSKGFLFFCCACCILVLTIINLSVGPIVSGTIHNNSIDIDNIYNSMLRLGNDGGTLNCALLSDKYDKSTGLSDKAKKYIWEWAIDECERRKGLHNVEYISFIFDIAIGFVCGLLGLLHHFDLKKEFVSKTGLIGLGCGFVGFVLTFIYVVYNGLVYTNYYDEYIYKRNSDGAFAEWKGNHYECFYYDDENPHAVIAKYSDLINKQYNYDKDLKDEFDSSSTSEAAKCQYDANDCSRRESIYENDQKTYSIGGTSKNCKYLYVTYSEDEVTNKDKSDRFLTTLILSLFVCLANIGLALFGFLLFRTPGEF